MGSDSYSQWDPFSVNELRAKEANGKVIVIGSTNWDICMYLSHLPQPGETVGGGRLKSNLGGKGANQAVACHQAGAKTAFISCIGSDDTGNQVRQQLEGLMLDTSLLIASNTQPTGTACIFIDDAGENCIGLTPGANDELSEDIVIGHKNAIGAASVLLLQLEIPMPAVLAAAKLASESNTYVILNPAPAVSLPDGIFAYLDLLTPNRGELQMITGMVTDTEEQLVAAAESLIKKGVGQIMVTLGSDGALLVTPNGHSTFSSYPVLAKDTTAAGDCFNGYLAAGIALNGAEAIESVSDTACAAAAIAVTREGAIPSIPASSDVAAFLTRNNA